MNYLKTYEYFSNQVSVAGVSVDGWDSQQSSANDTRKNKNKSDDLPLNQKIITRKKSKRPKIDVEAPKVEFNGTQVFKKGDFYLGI